MAEIARGTGDDGDLARDIEHQSSLRSISNIRTYTAWRITSSARCTNPRSACVPM
jgi:hypothetical protein